MSECIGGQKMVSFRIKSMDMQKAFSSKLQTSWRGVAIASLTFFLSIYLVEKSIDIFTKKEGLVINLKEVNKKGTGGNLGEGPLSHRKSVCSSSSCTPPGLSLS